MAKKKNLKKFIALGLGAAALSNMAKASQMKEFLKTEGGGRSIVSPGYKDKIMSMAKNKEKMVPLPKPKIKISFGDAAKKVMKEKLNLGRGPGIKATDSLAGMGQGNTFGLGPMDGAKYGKMIKASNGTMVMSRGCKLGRHKATKIT